MASVATDGQDGHGLKLNALPTKAPPELLWLVLHDEII